MSKDGKIRNAGAGEERDLDRETRDHLREKVTFE